MSSTMVVKVPQVHGKSSLSMCELMEEAWREGSWGKEKLCTAWKVPGLDALGTKERGKVWNGPSSTFSCARMKGPTYWPNANLCWIVELYTSGNCNLDRWFGGVKVLLMAVMPR